MNTSRTLPWAALLLASVPLAQEVPDPGKERWLAHYDRVTAELSAKDTGRLDPAARAARERTIQALRDYRTAGVFPINTTDVQGRRRMFRDADGRRCAVANLIHVWGEDGLLDRLVANDNHAFLLELREDGEFLAWLDDAGISLQEAARIHAPGFTPPDPPPPETTGTFAPPSAPSSPAPPGSGPAQPSPPAPATPMPDGPCPGAAPGSASTPGPAGPSPAARPNSPGPSDVLANASWWQWWEYNKLRWMPVHRITESAARLVGSEDRTVAHSLLDEMRSKATPKLERGLRHAQPDVRAAAAIALGRIAREAGTGDQVAPLLQALLADPSAKVRESALLGLGAIGTRASLASLFAVAKQEGPNVGIDASPVATLALGLASLQMDEPLFAVLCPELLAAAREERTTATGASLVMAHLLEQSGSLRSFVRASSGLDDKQTAHVDVATRARAIEAMPWEDGADLLPKVLGALGDARLEIRRSAAVAAGKFTDPLALQPLMTAFELEEDELTRGLLLVSIGGHRVEEAREFLLHSLRHDAKSVRPWAALALGIYVQGSDNDVVREAIRTAHAKERNADRVGAYLLGSGIAGDHGALDTLRAELLRSKNPRTRMVAASALTILGSEAARDAVLAGVQRERNDEALAGMLQALASFGDTRDVSVLTAALAEFENPERAAQVASALGAHGTYASLHALMRALDDPDLNGLTESVLLQSVGMLLDEQPPFALARLSKDANYTVFPRWLQAALATTL